MWPSIPSALLFPVTGYLSFWCSCWGPFLHWKDVSKCPGIESFHFINTWEISLFSSHFFTRIIKYLRLIWNEGDHSFEIAFKTIIEKWNGHWVLFLAELLCVVSCLSYALCNSSCHHSYCRFNLIWWFPGRCQRSVLKEGYFLFVCFIQRDYKEPAVSTFFFSCCTLPIIITTIYQGQSDQGLLVLCS